MDWKIDGKRLVRRGELILSLDLLKGYFVSGFVCYLFSILYRHIEGFTKPLNRLIRRFPSMRHE